ncbi:MAG: ThuA domain-containing protein [Verrucomicrobia bacterium]|nr:ThuA domain-containing protein [Verrucomicrobiota bacterium]
MPPLTRLRFAALLCLAPALFAAPMHKVMLLTGQSNKYHDWTKSSPLVKAHLEQTGLFTVDVVTSPARGSDMSAFNPKFSAYAAIVLIYEGDEWPAATKAAFVDYMKNGGGLVTIHDSDNAFPYWPEFNEMIAVGGWGFKKDGVNIGARDATWGPKIRWRDGRMVLDSETPGNASHPPRHDFPLIVRAPDHPIMRGLASPWVHANDEIYSHLRGPAKNVTVLATALADKAKFPTASGEHEPMLMTITYGKGRIFHTTLGHVGPNDKPPYTSLTCAGFIATIQRGTEWAATGQVTQKVPADFPTAEKTSLRN